MNECGFVSVLCAFLAKTQAMSITVQQFKLQCEAFCKIDSIREDGWMLCRSDLDKDHQVYLMKQSHIVASELVDNRVADGDGDGDMNTEEEEEEEWLDEIGDDSETNNDNDVDLAARVSSAEHALRRGTVRPLLEFEVHIVYNAIFCVPVLYFRVSKSQFDGDKPVYLYRHEDILREIMALHESHPIVPREINPWTFISHGEHPVLGTVFQYVHPCQTQEIMDTVRNEDNPKTTTMQNYILSWLSFYGPVIRLYPPRHIKLPK